MAEETRHHEAEDNGDHKADMSLDEIIKLNRDTMMHSPVRSNSTSSHRSERYPAYREYREYRRESIRRAAASRSAAIRQGKLPERSASHGYFSVRRTLPPSPPRSRGWSHGRNDVFKRSGMPRRHLTPGDKVDIYEGAAGKLKISVINENSKPPRTPPRERNYRSDYQRHDYDDEYDYEDRSVQVMPFSTKTEDYHGPKRHRTLDSLFASIKEQRECGRVQCFGSGRFRAQSFRRF